MRDLLRSLISRDRNRVGFDSIILFSLVFVLNFPFNSRLYLRSYFYSSSVLITLYYYLLFLFLLIFIFYLYFN